MSFYVATSYRTALELLLPVVDATPKCETLFAHVPQNTSISLRLMSIQLLYDSFPLLPPVAP